MTSRVRAGAVLAFAALSIGLPVLPSQAESSIPDCGTPLMASAATPVGVADCAGIRPGAWVSSSAGRCTFNFIFDGSDGRTYAGTAGHCILGTSGQSVWGAGSGPQASYQSNRLSGAVGGGWSRAGEFAYAVLNNSYDFALVRVDQGVAGQVSASMCHFGGPTGYNDDVHSVLDGPTVFHHFGNGIGVGWAVPGRTMVAPAMINSPRISAYGTGVFGDSGSGVISADGRAVGVLVTLGVGPGGTNGITRLRPQVQAAESALGITLTLRTAPLA